MRNMDIATNIKKEYDSGADPVVLAELISRYAMATIPEEFEPFLVELVWNVDDTRYNIADDILDLLGVSSDQRKAICQHLFKEESQ